mgnify:CR=1 FL=1
MKKAVSFILAAIMLIMLPAGAFADSAQCSCDTPPVVMVNGFGTELYHDNGDGTQSAVFPMGAVEIVSAIPSLAGAFAALAAGNRLHRNIQATQDIDGDDRFPLFKTGG